MDQNTGNQDSSCAQYIYSDDYIGYLIKYDNDRKGIEEVMNPNCIQIINSRFLVAYKEAPGTATPEELSGFFDYGYHNLPKLYTLMDVSAVEDIGATAVRDIPGLNLDGRDVIIGLVDTGIDYRNPAFLDRTGNTRIEYIWDQNQESYMVGKPIYGFGGEFSREEINRVIKGESSAEGVIPPGDDIGHGTFLASIAGGNEDLEENFTGVATGASIIMVKLKEAPRPLREFYKYSQTDVCYSEADIALGISYLIQKAVQLAKPMVICLGLGTTLGDHAGNSNLELYIDNLAGLRGICFVAPVGNELGKGQHYVGGGAYGGDMGFATSGGLSGSDISRPETMEINVEDGVDGFILEIWGNAPGLLKVMVESPSGQRFNNISPSDSGSFSENFLFEGTGVFVENVVVDSLSGDQVYFIRFDKPAQGIWRIVVQETINQLGGGFNGWISAGQSWSDKISFVRPSPEITITAPGSCPGVITVSAYNNDNNAIYVNASRGYTRKGSVKPDITAPGVDIKGVFASGGGASSGEEASPGEEVSPGGEVLPGEEVSPGGGVSSGGGMPAAGRVLYSNRSGTSIATAFTAGAAALMLQWGIVERNNLGINTEIIKQMLIRGANRENSDIYPNNIWGWGKLDVLKSYEVSR